MKVHPIPARNGKYCFQFEWLGFTRAWSQIKGPRSQFLSPWYLGKLGLSKTLVKWSIPIWVAVCFGNFPMCLHNLMFQLLICLYFAAWEKIGWDAKTWLEEELKCLPVLKKKKKSQPTKAPHYGGADRGFNRINTLGCFSLTSAFKYKPAVCCCIEASPFVLSRHVKSIWVSPEKGWPRQEPINWNSSMQSWLIWNAFYQASYNGL